ncbi:putative heterokaryon incompatibility protein [Rosellinia necatrix]|uniref:Putative heterokaryon incompatibility protein n=1 Tax=Rosellinia necatrix TaxID=77044 RepID=A0A1W2TSJ1_ROSNE|nr:putative heterokaryon incompatibility protein [Rosellinia necatrix]
MSSPGPEHDPGHATFDRTASTSTTTTATAATSDQAPCDFCANLVSIFSRPVGAHCTVPLGEVSDIVAARCAHAGWVRGLEFRAVGTGEPHRCAGRGYLGVAKAGGEIGAVLRKRCFCWSSDYETLSSTDPFEPLARDGDGDGDGDGDDSPAGNGRARLLDGEWIDVDLLRGWRARCERQHGAECGGDRVGGLGAAAAAGVVVQPKWLIDVVRGCISPHDDRQPPRRYLALSYTWGRQAADFGAWKRNVEQLQQPGALLPDGGGAMAVQVPATIRDAMGVTRQLGETYLWVDRLCIVQDDDDDLHDALRQMHLIFSGSALNIIAEAGRGADHGIRGVRGVSRPRSVAQTRVRLGGETLVSLEGEAAARRWRPPSEHDYHRRMWTFQEYLFSRRRLVFGGAGTAAWECGRARWVEHLRPHAADDARDHHRREARDPVGRGLASRMPSLHDLGAIVGAFNRKVLTYPEDVLFAFSGMQAMLARHKFPAGGLLYGLPEFYLDVALLWHFDGPQRQQAAEERKRRRPSPQFRGDPLRDKLPSWSWMGWEAAVRFPVDSEFESSILTGFDGAGFVAPVAKWFTLESPVSETGREIESRWHYFRALDSDMLPDGWSREPRSLGSYYSKRQTPKSPPEFAYSHVFEPSRFFWYPVPLASPNEVKHVQVQTQYLRCETSRAFLYKKQDRTSEFAHWNTPITDGDRNRIGGLQSVRPPEHRLSEIYEPQLEKIELVAIVKGWIMKDYHQPLEYPNPAHHYSRPDANHQLSLQEASNEWEKMVARKLDCYYVLCVEWEGGVAYRTGAGFVFADAWEKYKDVEPVRLVLG